MLPGIGVFGTGKVIEVIVPFLRDKGFKVEAIWGRTMNEAEEAAKRLQIPFWTNKIDNVLLRKDVDLIFIVCSPNLHAQIAVKALGIGKHVLCDKPAGLCQSEAIKMVHAAQYYPSLISVVNHSLRFLPAFVQMKKQIIENKIGNVFLCDVKVQMGRLYGDNYNWLCDKTMGGGVLTLVGSHVIDLVTYLTDQKAIRVHGIVKTFNKDFKCMTGVRQVTSPDFCTFQMEMADRSLVTVTLNNHLAGTYIQEVLMCGTEGNLIVKGGDLFKDKDEVLYLDVEDLQKSDAINVVSADIMPRPCMKGLLKMISALREAFLPVEDKRGWIKEPVSSAATFEDSLYVQAVIDAIRSSSGNKEWVKVEVITEEPDPNPSLSAAVRKSGMSM